MVKSPDAFRTIREVAEWLDTPAHVLRFWESRFAQVKPVKRAGGRRYYRPSDMELLGGIKQLLHEDGLTIRGVQKLLREQGVRHVAAKSPALGLDPARAPTDNETASGMARHARARAGRAAPSPDLDGSHRGPARPQVHDARRALHTLDGDCAPTGEGGDSGAIPARSAPSTEGNHADCGGEDGPGPEGQVTAEGSAPPTPPPALPEPVPPAYSADSDPDARKAPDAAGSARAPHETPHAPTAAENRAEVAPPPASAPILSDLWNRRLSGSLGETGPVLARALALLRSMDARD